MLPDWFVPNECYTVLFFHRVILYLLSLCSLPLMRIDPLDVAGPSLLIGYCYDKVFRYTEMNQGLYQPIREMENANENIFIFKSCSLFSKPKTRFSPIEMSEERGKCGMFLSLHNNC